LSLEVENLTKIFGDQKAVDAISFSARPGEILGFLGPNGAGKSTTMKIATGFLGATSGTIKINGLDIAETPIESRKKIGYLPEHNPLYHEMYVHEYLEFSGKAYSMTRGEMQNAIPEIIFKCGLTSEQNKKIGQLSKGFRQRVGLAQALLHNPEILILDEPTTGLDPNQILEIRKLIKEVSRDKTVIFSTHIMQEVKALCDRVVIINKGKILADQSLEALEKSAGKDKRFKVEFKEAIDHNLLRLIDKVSKVTIEQDGVYTLHVAGEHDIRTDIFRLAADQNLPLLELQEEGRSLDEIFHSITNQL